MTTFQTTAYDVEPGLNRLLGNLRKTGKRASGGEMDRRCRSRDWRPEYWLRETENGLMTEAGTGFLAKQLVREFREINAIGMSFLESLATALHLLDQFQEVTELKADEAGLFRFILLRSGRFDIGEY
ncbi:hypothetical protein ACIU1J_30070 [Azospirillum doebereinerae]|uniref:hypothetical protein n=1 Tax=Azospirillum doebereinerae TaxID=92933 RepID=UPI001EE546A5|nr:hypothetical protein [Azospirillum doebereinerae]MCG5240937.1 hypothetical protein [Azospirillum doebereinerae]